MKDLVAGVSILLVLAAYVFFAGGRALFERHQRWDHSLYASLAEGFRRGHLYLEQQPDHRLRDLQNPYDPAARENIPYVWDASYYKGRYYLYFSPVPTLFFYLPFRFAFGGYPSDALAALFFSLWAFFMSVAFVRRAVGTWPAYILLIGVGNLTPFLLVDPHIYEVAIFAGAAISATWAYALLLFVERPTNRGAMWMALWLALAIAARANLAVLIVVSAAALFLAGGSGRVLIKRFALASVPLLSVLVLLLGYNAARFGTVVEAGHTYQLTAMDMKGRSVCGIHTVADMWRFANSMMHYVSWPLTFNASFPFVQPQGARLDPTVSYPASEEVVGIVPLLPIAIVGTLFAGLMALRFQQSSSGDRSGLYVITGAWLIVLGLSACWYVVARYELDFILLMLVASIVVIESALSLARSLNFPIRPLRIGIAVIAFYSTAVGTLLGFAGRDGAFQRLHPGWTLNRDASRALYSRTGLRRFADEAILLLPLAGTPGYVTSARGTRWKVDQTIRNTTDRVIPVVVTFGDDEREIDLRPGETAPITSENRVSPYAIVHAERKDISHIEVKTALGAISIPTVTEPDLRRSPMIVPGVPLTSRSRLNLRLWTFRTTRPVPYAVSLHSARVELASRMFATRRDAYQIDSDFLTGFPQLALDDSRADLVISLPDSGPDARMWAFVTATDNETGAVTMYYPR